MKKIAIIQHQLDEDEGYVKEWSQQREIELARWLVASESTFNPAIDFDGVIILGGSANVEDVASLPWMQREISWLEQAIKKSIPCFGICLGAQLLASILKAQVVPLEQPERGIEKLYLNREGIFANYETEQLSVLQAHSFRFDIPNSAINYASSSKCNQQLFIDTAGKVLGIQCHLEWSLQKFQQLFSESSKLRTSAEFDEVKTKHLLFFLLDKFFSESISI